ncbi:hypothetical protein [Carboxylicivirga marina]|uniref:hypothetical protein n=1 Tax=Carboxylicivirga marina TaxID=2800988 RepID=UPI002593D530|nr:hypothetical protein [uncultured Carboxylicivirga sp.]
MGIFNFKKKNQIPDSFHKKSELVGIYTIPNHNDVKLIEIVIDEHIADFDPGQITQEQKGQDKLNWQTAYDEKYLNEEGNEIIGDDFDKPNGLTRFRVVFFFHYLDFNKSLISQYGLIKLKQEIDLPDRLSKIIEYEPID